MDRYLRWVFLLGIWLIAEVLGYYGLRRLGFWRRWMGWSTVGAFVGLLLLYGVGFLVQGLGQHGHTIFLWLQRVAGIVFLGWLAIVLAKLLGGIVGVGAGVLPQRRLPSREEAFQPERRATLQVIGGTLASLPAVALGYGFWIGRFRFQVHTVEVALPDLPASWEGVTFVQLSDLHSGSFLSPRPLEEVWEKVQKLSPDVILFTGDWVNAYGWELEPFVQPLSQLNAPLGKWAILGNHDYGDYARWRTPEARAQDHAYLRQLIQKTGFTLLDNEAILLQQQGEQLALVGVGNWSSWRRFQRYGDLAKAWQKVPPQTCAILLTHDPTHWEAQVLGKYPISLTLSGHTHGLQMGVEWGQWRFSPAAWLYKHWAGLYQEGAQFLYVNRGLGYIGVPARLGIWPEVTLLRLRRAAHPQAVKGQEPAYAYA